MKTLFAAFLILKTSIGVKAAESTNDFLTIIKLTARSILFLGVGLTYMVSHTGLVVSNLSRAIV